MYSKFLAYMLWLFSGFGWLGLHRFYLRKPLSGIIWILTGGLFGIGAIYDLVTLGGQVDLANLKLGYVPAYTPASPFGQTRRVNDGEARIIREKEIPPEQAALRAAKRNKGVVSAADLALEAGISLDKAKVCLETMTAKGHAEMRVRSNGTIVFTINEFLEDDGAFEA